MIYQRILNRPVACLTLAIALAFVVVACEKEVVDRPIVEDAPPVYTGPSYLRGTVGSLVKVQGFQPLLVSGFGLVVNLEDTGSTGIPTYLRQRMVNYARQMGLGSANLQTMNMGPEQVLSDRRTALVRVSGLIPPGAVPGQRFDVLVEALPQTETTSLVGGTLWTTEMGIQGASPSVPFVRTLANGRGAIYTDPFADSTINTDLSLRRRAAVVGGGRVAQARRLRLVLNQPSWFRSGAIANRINERFPMPPNSTVKTANAQTDLYIDINIPPRFQNDPADFLRLIGALYLQGGEGFEVRQAQRLAQVLRDKPNTTADVATAWKSMGRIVLPEIRKLYVDSSKRVRLAALDAGSWMRDPNAIEVLKTLAADRDPAMRIEAAKMLAYLARNQDAEMVLTGLLDDPNITVRLEAYDALSRVVNSAVQRFEIRDSFGVKYVIDRVMVSQRPMIYVTQERLPKIVIFGSNLQFPRPMVARLWDNRLMMRYPDENGVMKVFYQAPGSVEPRIETLQPSVETLIYMLGHRSSAVDPQAGFDMTYGQVVHAIYDLQKQGYITANLEVEPNPLAKVIDEQQEKKTLERRSEFGGMEGMPSDDPNNLFLEGEPPPQNQNDGSEPARPAQPSEPVMLPEPVQPADVEQKGKRLDF